MKLSNYEELINEYHRISSRLSNMPFGNGFISGRQKETNYVIEEKIKHTSSQDKGIRN